MTRKVIITNRAEPFTRSNCQCLFCLDMHQSVNEWDSFKVTTNLQIGMKRVVEKIETRSLKKSKIN
jgi:hypothetical protein